MHPSAYDVMSAYLEKPRKSLLFNAKNGEHYYLTLSEEVQYLHGEYVLPKESKSSISDFFLFVARRFGFIQDMREGFMIKEGISHLFSEKALRSTPDFNRTLKREGMWKRYVNFFVDCFLAELAHLSFAYGLKDKEATKSQYAKIRRLMEEYESYRFEEVAADCNLFSLAVSGLSPCDFIVMGNAGQTYGLSFYLGCDGKRHYRAFMRDANNAHQGTETSCLSPTVSLYCNSRTPMPNLPFDNPFGNDNLYSSIAWGNGRKYDCYLPSLLAKALIRQLPAVIDALYDNVIELDVKRITERNTDAMFFLDDDGYYMNIFPRTESDLDRARSALTTLAEGSPRPKIPLEKPNHEEWCISLRMMPMTLDLPYPSDQRCSAMQFVILACENKSGYILNARLAGLTEEGSLFDQIVKQTLEAVKGYGRPKAIYVNSALDWELITFALDTYIKNGTKIIAVGGETSCDRAYDALTDEFLNRKNLPQA